MEFLFELFCELVLQVIGELFVQLLFESVVRLGSVRFSIPLRRQIHPVTALFGFLALGMLVGVITLWPFPNSFITDHMLRIANLLITPLAAGGFTVLVGARRRKRGKVLLRIDRFKYAYAFAAGMALMRFVFTAQW